MQEENQEQFTLNRYNVIYRYKNTQRGFITTAHDRFEAEETFLTWAKDLPGKVVIKRVSRIDDDEF